ncbi:MAG: oligosaccharide flippase family protein [Vicinamibacteria bacterium]
MTTPAESSIPPPKSGSALQKLAKLSLAYATGDVLAQGINFLLVPLYMAFLEPEDYGSLALLFLLSVMLKTVFRLGLDQGFFRIYYDVKEEDRSRFAGTVAIFSAVLASSVFVLVCAFARPISVALFQHPDAVLWVRLVAVDLLASSFVFVPLALFRIEGKASLLSTFSILRNLANTVVKVILVLMGYSVTGVLISDAFASILLATLLMFELRPRIKLAFDWPPLREALRFGLPKVPHGILVQMLNLADRRILDNYVSLGEVGIYSVGNNFGGAMKFPLSAFEPAWQPFVFQNAKKEGGALEIAQIATRMAILFTVTALALALILPDVLIFLSRNPKYHGAAPVVPVVILAFLLQGYFLLSSIGITIAKEARYYPLITACAATINITLNVALIPYYGIMGSAWATVAGYLVMVVLGSRASNRLYPIPLSWSRILLTLGAAIAVFVAASFLGAGWVAVSLRFALFPAFAFAAWRFIYTGRDRDEFKKVFGF